jgi:hypothetical protein
MMVKREKVVRFPNLRSFSSQALATYTLFVSSAMPPMLHGNIQIAERSADHHERRPLSPAFFSREPEKPANRFSLLISLLQGKVRCGDISLRSARQTG